MDLERTEGQQGLELEDAPAQPAPDADPDESTSLRDHEAKYGDGAPVLEEEGDPDAEPAPPQAAPGRKPTHRSRSNKAGADDAPRIAKLTKDLRGTQETLSQREQRIAELERELNSRPAPAAPPPAAPSPAARVTPPSATGPSATFEEKEPRIEDFLNEVDPAGAHYRALAAYDRRKERWEEGQATARASSEAAQRQAFETARAEYDNLGVSYLQKAEAYAAKNPKFLESLKTIGERPTNDILIKVLWTEGPELVHTLSDSSWLYDEAFMLTQGKPATAANVESTRRWLLKKVEGVKTGASGPSRTLQTPVPRPSTPVRTGPAVSGDQPPDEESSSLSQHEAYWHNPARVSRRRR
jgi:hypothetical protein